MRQIALAILTATMSTLVSSQVLSQQTQESTAASSTAEPTTAATGKVKLNNWTFTSTRGRVPEGWYYVSIRRSDDKWVINSLNRTPAWGEIHRESSIEPFVVSPDLQQWTNYYHDKIGNCDSFAVQNSTEKNVCFSQFAQQTSAGKSMLRVLMGGQGLRMQEYQADLVNAAINSIDPVDAIKWLEKAEVQR